MIPPVIHRIWLGGAMPAEVAAYGAAWRDLHPGWTVHTWRDWDMPALRHQHWFDAARSPAQQADIARLELLHRFGGVYVDADFEPRRPIGGLIAATRCFAATEDGRWISTGIMGAVPGHPFIVDLIDNLPASIAAQAGAPPNRQTGPMYVTERYYAYADRDDAEPVPVFPPALFYPYHFSEPERRSAEFPDAYAVHHWAHTWDGVDDQR
jgi:mannosyltransferase OCH1-like enzyme